MALEQTILHRLHSLDEATLAEVLDFVEFLATRRAKKAVTDAAVAPPLSDDLSQAGPFFGFAPFPPRGGCVTEEVVNRLREAEAV